MYFTHLGNGNTTLFSQLLFGLLAGVWVAEVGVKVLVQDLRGLLAEVPSFPPERESQKVRGSIVL